MKSGQPLDWFDRAVVPALGHVAAALMLCLMLLTCADVVECSIEGVATLRTHIVSPGLVERRGHAA